MTNIGWGILISSTKPVGRDLSVVTKVIYVLVPVIGTVAMILAAIDPTFGPLLHATVVAVAIAGTYPTLETLWRRGRPVIHVLAATSIAIVLIPASITAALMELIYFFPVVQAQVETVSWFERHPALFVLIGYIAGLLGAMVIMIVILFPVMLLRRSDLAFAEFGADPDTPHLRKEFFWGWLLILAIFGFAYGLTFEMPLVAVPCLVVCVTAVVIVRRIQKSRR